MMVTMQQSMMELMSFMKTTMQTLVQNQNMVLQQLAAKQSKKSDGKSTNNNVERQCRITAQP